MGRSSISLVKYWSWMLSLVVVLVWWNKAPYWHLRLCSRTFGPLQCHRPLKILSGGFCTPCKNKPPLISLVENWRFMWFQEQTGRRDICDSNTDSCKARKLLYAEQSLYVYCQFLWYCLCSFPQFTFLSLDWQWPWNLWYHNPSHWQFEYTRRTPLSNGPIWSWRQRLGVRARRSINTSHLLLLQR